MTKRIVTAVVALFRSLASKEPAVLLGTLASLLVAAANELTSHGVKDWREVAPLAISLAIRKVVSSPATTDYLRTVVVEFTRASAESFGQTPVPPATHATHSEPGQP